MTKVAIRMMLETISSPGLKIGDRLARLWKAILSSVVDGGGGASGQPNRTSFGAVTVPRFGGDVGRWRSV